MFGNGTGTASNLILVFEGRSFTAVGQKHTNNGVRHDNYSDFESNMTNEKKNYQCHFRMFSIMYYNVLGIR